MQSCMQTVMDADEEARGSRKTTLARCLDASETQEEIDECVIISDAENEDSYG